MEVTNRFKGLDLIDKVPEKPFWTEVHDVVQDAVAKIMLKIKIYIYQQAKWLCGEALQRAEGRREAKGMEKGKETRLSAEFQRITPRDKNIFLLPQSPKVFSVHL